MPIWIDELHSDALRWLAQADKARRLAATLPPVDAGLLETFARECEAKAKLASYASLRAA